MASFWMRGAAAALGFVLTWVDCSAAAPPQQFRRPTTSSRRPTTPQKPTAQQPTTNKPTAPGVMKPAVPTPTAPKTGGVPMPTPPQPQRDDTVGTQPQSKPSIPHPGIPHPAVPQPPVAAEVAAPQPVAAPVKAAAPAVVTKSPSVDVKPDAEGRYTLRYQFSNGEVVRWQVEHRAKIVTSLQGTTQTAETATISQKVWRVVETLPGGEARFVHSVAAIDMRQKQTGRQELTYNSQTDADAPPIFADAAKQIGVPLSEVTIDARGNVVKREDKTPRPEGSPTNTITLVLPDRPLAVGESWTSPFDLTAMDASGKPKSIKARHKLTLEKVEHGLATIRNETQILSPLDDPTIEAQVVQAEQSGTVTFDLVRGRIIAQQSALDKEVFGFQGADSKLHYTTTFSEALVEGPAAATVDAAPADGNPLR